MSRLQRQVEAFHALMGQHDPSTPTDPSDEVRMRRARLIMEEAIETCAALIGMGAALDDLLQAMCDRTADKRGLAPGGMPEIIDGCSDVSVVCAGTMLELGVLDDPIHECVMRANMAKLGGGRDAHGKIQKPAGWTPPDVATELVVQGWRRDGGL